ncbi:MAG: hypothetical protein LC737_02265 [Chloroflexi bacterium]|nr:hypothetical protein [Chloroflexota bacterium]
MYSRMLSPDVPEWLEWLFAVVSLIVVAFGAGEIGMQFMGPYTLRAATSAQKWRYALAITSLETLPILIGGFAVALLSPLPDQSPFIWFCIGIWIVVLAVFTPYNRWNLERQLKLYLMIDRWIKEGRFEKVRSSPFSRWMTWFMTSEYKRFLTDGYPQDSG